MAGIVQQAFECAGKYYDFELPHLWKMRKDLPIADTKAGDAYWTNLTIVREFVVLYIEKTVQRKFPEFMMEQEEIVDVLAIPPLQRCKWLGKLHHKQNYKFYLNETNGQAE